MPSLWNLIKVSSVQFSPVAQSCSTLCNPMNRSTSGLPVHHHSRSPPKPMSIESVMPSNHLILCRPLLFLPPIFPSFRVFSNESALRVRRSKHILKEISPGCSLEGLMLKLKLQYFGHLMRRADSLEKTLMLGQIEGRRRRGRQRMRWLDGIIYSMDKGLGELREW